MPEAAQFDCIVTAQTTQPLNAYSRQGDPYLQSSSVDLPRGTCRRPTASVCDFSFLAVDLNRLVVFVPFDASMNDDVISAASPSGTVAHTRSPSLAPCHAALPVLAHRFCCSTLNNFVPTCNVFASLCKRSHCTMILSLVARPTPWLLLLLFHGMLEYTVTGVVHRSCKLLLSECPFCSGAR